MVILMRHRPRPTATATAPLQRLLRLVHVSRGTAKSSTRWGVGKSENGNAVW
ncbi:hypothetical protein FRB94_014566 [Tulasnella sp. JGI-2019a]|nr:hypothetical protein FRB94_014566 [Tulasnella sp. JGI-2019a]